VEALPNAAGTGGHKPIKENISIENLKGAETMETNIAQRRPITMKEVFINAKSYVPLMQKEEIVSYCAERCIDRVVVNTGEKFRGDTPPMYRENGQRKRRYLLGILARAYLRLDFEGCGGDRWLMSADDYDWVGGVQLINQIDRMKKQSDALRDKAYDLLADYRDLEKMMNTEINANLSIMNDVVARMSMSAASAMTPESVQELVELAERVQKDQA
jgi:hypothetical protein